MGTDNSSVFISYSWDNTQHEKWVERLYRTLRRKGVDATFDKIETQLKTVNLNEMMVRNLREKDYIIIVLTKNYAYKADHMQGGVGYETLLSLSAIRKDPDRFLFVLKEHKDSIPFHLEGFHYFDFTNEAQFDIKTDELVRRIYKVPLIEEEPLGEPPDFSSRSNVRTPNPFEEIKFSRKNEVTDLDKDRFLRKTYLELKSAFEQLFDHLKHSNPAIEIVQDTINDQKTIFNFYLHGRHKTGLKMWVGSGFLKGIQFEFGQRLDPSNDNAMNLTISCETNAQGELHLRTLMASFSTKDTDDINEIVKLIWNHYLEHYFV